MSLAQKSTDCGVKLWTERLGAGSIGPSWMKALAAEFKKEYFTKVLTGD